MSDGKLIFDTSIDTSGFEADLTGLSQKTNSGVGSIVKGMLGADLIKKAGSEILDFAAGSLTAASDLQEVDNVIQVTFGDNAPLIEAFAEKATKSFGMTETAAKRYTGTFGSILKAMGMTDEQTLEFSQNLTGLAADLASFYNIDFETAYQKLRSGLVGETEPMMDLGIDLRVSALEEYAEGLGLVYSELSSTEQAAVRYAAIMDKTGDVQGDFSRTSDSFSNQMKIFETNIANLQVLLGEKLLPVANSVLTFFNGLFNIGENGEIAITDKLTNVTEKFEAFNAAAEEAETNFETAQTTLEGRATLAETYMTTLETLEGKEIKTDEDIAAINNAVVALNTLYPNLKATMDPATGALNMNTEAIRNNIAALQQLALQDLFDEQWKANADAMAQAVLGLADAETVLEEASKPLDEVDAKIAGVQAVMEQLGNNNFEGVNAAAGQYANLINGFDRYFEQKDDGSWSAIEGTPANLEALEYDISAALNQLNAERETLLQGISEAQAAVDGYNQAIADITDDQADISAKQEKVKELMNAAGSDAADAAGKGVTDNGSSVSEAVDTVISDAAKNVDTNSMYTAGVEAVTAFIKGLVSKAIPTLKARTSVSGSGVDGSHASGLNYVPFNGYIAQLHVGESVLNARDAQKWRSGEGGTAAAPAAPMASARPEVNVYIDGEKVSKVQKRSNSAQLALDNIRNAKGVGSR